MVKFQFWPHFKPKLKTHYSSLNDIVQTKFHKIKNKKRKPSPHEPRDLLNPIPSACVNPGKPLTVAKAPGSQAAKTIIRIQNKQKSTQTYVL